MVNMSNWVALARYDETEMSQGRTFWLSFSLCYYALVLPALGCVCFSIISPLKQQNVPLRFLSAFWENLRKFIKLWHGRKVQNACALTKGANETGVFVCNVLFISIGDLFFDRTAKKKFWTLKGHSKKTVTVPVSFENDVFLKYFSCNGGLKTWNSTNNLWAH